MQSVTVVGRGDQRELRARRKGKDRNALSCISKCSGEMIHSLSLIRHWVIARPTTNDNDKARLSALLGRTKISGLDPLLMTVLDPVHGPPLPAFFDPVVERAAWGPRD
jgi:hypothetical protein